MRLIYLKNILKIEHQVKTILGYEFSRLYGNNNYLKINNFDVSNPQKIKEVNKLIDKIKSETKNQINKNAEITHYNNKYGFIPLRVLTNILTIGEISHFYKCLKESDKNDISKHFCLNSYDMALFLKNLTLARNLCAHDERFYDYRYKASIPIKHINNFKVFNIKNNSSGFYYHGVKDAFSIAVIFTQFLPKEDIRAFIYSMKKEFKVLKKQSNVISIKKIMRIMGFCSRWTKLIKL